ncbi:MAG TPA: GNAT family N-acetyltransferase [Puia sp.]|nr:GNAT family N-acetyltransferase [Puia sp.]
MNTGYHIRDSAGTRHRIRYVSHQHIDAARWDTCIDQATNPLIYSCHFYLDHMAAGQWDALILGDYEAVMPLTWRRKYGIRYLYQPPFTQQTGIFSPQPLPAALIDAFFKTVHDHFRFAEIFLNGSNLHPGLQPCANYILPLDATYARIAAKYKKDLQRNLKHAARFPFLYSTEPDLGLTLESYRREYGARTPHIGPGDYARFATLCHYCHTRDQLVLRAAATPDGEIMATALLLRDRHRLYLLQSTTPAAGRPKEANHFLLDQLIREWAESGLTLDFEGSELPGVAHFYKNFGSIDQPYYFYRYNRLPWFVSLFKR